MDFFPIKKTGHWHFATRDKHLSHDMTSQVVHRKHGSSRQQAHCDHQGPKTHYLMWVSRPHSFQ